MAANPFDQFDVAQTAAPSVASTSSSNAFDQFDAQPVSAGKKNAFGHVPPKQSDLTALETLDDSKANAPLGKADTAMLIGKQIWDAAVYHAPAAFAASLEGDDPYGEKDWKDSLIDRSRARIKEGAKLGDKDTQTAIPFVSAQDAKSLGPSLGFSAVGAGAGFAAGIPAGIAGNVVAPVAGTAAGYAAGGAASGAAAYRMSTNQFVRDLYEAANDESVKATGKPITAEEFKAKQDKLAESIKEYGLWEAVPEAVGNVAGFGIIKAPIKGAIGKLFGDNILKRFATKMGSLYGTELATETITQQGQHNVEVDAGLSKEEKRDWTSPSDIADSFKEVAPSTILQTTLMAGGVKGGQKLYDKMRKAESGGYTPPPSSTPPVDGAVDAADLGLSPDTAPAQEPTSQQSAPTQPAPAPAQTAAPAADPVAAPSEVQQQSQPDLSMQNRDRGSAASVLQMQSIANAPDFDRLNQSPEADSGAPMVSIRGNKQEVIEPGDIGSETIVTLPDGSKIQSRFAVVEADRILASHAADGSINHDYQNPQDGSLVALNNGRTAGLQESYRRGAATQPGGYAERLMSEAQRFGIQTAAVTGKNAPVLVRLYDDEINKRPDLAKQSNSGGSARMSAMEVARNDAAILPDMANLVFDETGDLNSPANQPFVRGFVSSLPPGEQAEVVDRAGNLSQVGATRIRNAIISKAYGETSVFGRLVESMDDSMRNMAKALVRAAPKVARMKELAAAGAVRDMDISPLVVKAADELTKLRQAGVSLADFLAQTDMFGKGVEGIELEVMQFLDANLRAPNRIVAFMDSYYAALEGLGSPNQGDMFGAADISIDQLVGNSINETKKSEGLNNDTGRGTGSTNSGVAKETGRPDANAAGDQGKETAQPVSGADTTGQGAEKSEGGSGGKQGAEQSAVKKEGPLAKAKKAEAKAKEKKAGNKFDPKGLQPGTPEYNAAYEEWMAGQEKAKENSSNDRQRKENQDAIDQKNKWRKLVKDWFESAVDGDTITDSTGQTYVVSVKTRKDGKVTKTLLAVDESGNPLPDGRAATGIAMVGDRVDGLGDGSLDQDTGSEHPETSAQSFASSLGQQLEDGDAQTGSAPDKKSEAKPEAPTKQKSEAAEAKIATPPSDRTPVKDWPLERLQARLDEIKSDPIRNKSAIDYISGLIAEKSVKPSDAPSAQTETAPVQAEASKQDQAIDLGGKRIGDILEMDNGNRYRIEGVDKGKVRATRNPDQLNERIVLLGQVEFDRLAKEDSEVKAEAVRSGLAAQSDAEITKRITIAADSIEKLRKVDVERVLTQGNLDVEKMAEYIKRKRPDLSGEVDSVIEDSARPEKAPESDVDRGKAMMAEGFDELISLLGGKANMLPEEEAKIIPIMSKIFRGAALIGYSKFKDASKYVMDTLRAKAPDVADKIDIDNLQAGYINAMKSIDGPSSKAEVIAFESIEQLYQAENSETQAAKGNDSAVERNQAEKPKERRAEDLPPGFLMRHQVTIDSFNKDSGKMEQIKVSADEALKAANDDVSAFKSLLKCVGG